MFSSALVSRLARSPSPHLAAPSAQQPLRAPSTSNVPSFVRSVLPLYALGLVRFLTVTAADYQAHVSEYGVHWNFFLTMAVVTTIMHLLPVRQRHALPAAAALALLHQAALSLGARDYILHAPRTSGFFSANREGIIGSLGYISIYLSSVAVGARCFSLPPPAKVRFLFAAAVAAAAAFVTCELVLGMEASRRLMNLPYLLASIAANCFGLALCMLCTRGDHRREEQQQHAPASSRLPLPSSSPLFQLISQNQLEFFLICNVATGMQQRALVLTAALTLCPAGAINLCLRTLAVTRAASIAIVITYM
jgi:phosphatidylinositol glycan class W